jgi:hypothetical protein
MISGCGLISWMRFPTVVYMAAKSVSSPVPQVGVEDPAAHGRLTGSFLMSIAATSPFDLYRSVMSCQAAVNFPAGQRLVVPQAIAVSVRAAPAEVSRWQLGMTMRPSSVSARTQAS